MADQFRAGDSSSSPAPSGPRYLLFASAGLVLVASLLTFYEIDFALDEEEAELGAALLGGFLETSWTAWSDAWGIFPLMPIVLLSAIAAAVWLAADHAPGVNAPKQVLGVPGSAVRVIVGSLAVLTVAAYALRTFLTEGEDTVGLGIGGWLLLAGSIGYLVGAVLDGKESLDPGGDRRSPELSSPSSLVIIISAAIVLVASFLPAFGAAGLFAEDGSGAETTTPWSDGFRPVYGLPAIASALVVILLVLGQQDMARAPLGVAGARWRRTLCGFALISALALLIGNPVFGAFSSFIDVEYGQYLTLLGAAGLVAGCVMEHLAGRSAASEEPPTTF